MYYHHLRIQAAAKSAPETQWCSLRALVFAKIAKRGSFIAVGLQHSLRDGPKNQFKLVKVPTLPLPENQ